MKIFIAVLIAAAVSASLFPSTVSAQLIDGALIAYWSFDDQANPAKDDYDGHNGTVNGATWTATGHFNGALYFDGDNDDVTVPDDGSLSGMSALTVAAWFKSESFTSPHGSYLVCKSLQGDGSHLSDSYLFALLDRGEGMTGLYAALWSGTHTWDPSEEEEIIYNSVIPTSEWHHAAVTYDGAMIKLYLDGDEVATTPFVAPLGYLNITTGTNLTIGDLTGSLRDGHFHGTIDEVYLYGRALSDDEITCLADVNSDGDGYSVCDDCDDTDSSVYPGAPEICDGLDNDCDDNIPADEDDADLDGLMVCEGDCHDQDDTLPISYEIPGNLSDENCDGSLGECDPNREPPWKNHGQYVRCVAHETDALIEDGYITQDEGDALISSAAQSDIGKK